MKNKYNFESKFKLANLVSFLLVLGSLFLISFKGLNFGIDFKGGTLIELRSKDNQNVNLSDFREKANSLNFGEVSVQSFGKESDILLRASNVSV